VAGGRARACPYDPSKIKDLRQGSGAEIELQDARGDAGLPPRIIAGPRADFAKAETAIERERRFVVFGYFEEKRRSAAGKGRCSRSFYQAAA